MQTQMSDTEHRARIARFGQLMAASGGDLGILLAQVVERIDRLQAAVERITERVERVEAKRK